MDNAGPPEGFYWTEKWVYGLRVMPPDSEFLVGCHCVDGCERGKCSCPSSHDCDHAYTRDNRLRDASSTMPIIECNFKCRCGPDCGNRVVQNGKAVRTEIFRCGPTKGWGVRTLEFVKKGQFVAEYVGEIITVEEAEERELFYQIEKTSYLFNLDGFLDATKTEDAAYVIDAYQCGNITRFMNHSCDPNMRAVSVLSDGAEYRMHRVAFFAIKDIEI